MFRLIYISYFTLHYFIDIIVVICSVKVYSVLSLKVPLSYIVFITFRLLYLIYYTLHTVHIFIFITFRLLY